MLKRKIVEASPTSESKAHESKPTEGNES